MKHNHRFEMFLLICGGALLVLGAARGGLRTFEYLASHNFSGIPPGTIGAGPAFAAGMVFGNLSMFAIGIGLLWLACAKRSRRSSVEPVL